jgi:hypothetical protein
VHGGDGELGKITLLTTLALNDDSVVAFTIVKVQAGIFIMINNNTETFTNSFSWHKPRLRCSQTFIFDALAALHWTIILRLFAESRKYLRSLPCNRCKLKLNGYILSFKIQGWNFVHIYTQVFAYDFSRFIPAIF